MTTSTLPVAFVDDDADVRKGLETLLGVYGRTCTSYDSATAFRDGYDPSVPTCILIDKKLSDGDGLDLIAFVRREAQAPVAPIMVTGHGDIETAVQAMRLGAVDFIEKPVDPDRLLEALEQADKTITRIEDKTINDADASNQALETLTIRERDVLRQLIDGHPNKIVAYNLGISPRTVEVHRARIMKKSGARTFADLLKLALAADLS